MAKNKESKTSVELNSNKNGGALAVISAQAVSNYVVCPESWRLKYLVPERKQKYDENQQIKGLRKEWVAQHDLSAKLRYYAKIVYLLLVLLTIFVFLLESRRVSTPSKFHKSSFDPNSAEELKDH